jgi:cell division protein FtsW
MRFASTLLMVCVAVLLALGMVVLYSASMSQRGAHFLVMQLAWCALGLVACVVTASLDYRRLRQVSFFLYGLAVIMLLLVLVPGIGMKINGARRWFDLKIMNFQPSEMAKLALIIMLAHYGERYRRQMGGFLKGLVIPGAGIGLVLGLILAGKDYGTTMLGGAVCLGMLLIAGVRWHYLVPTGLVVFALLCVAIWHNPVRRARVLAWVDPVEHSASIAYQGEQAKIALGVGGWFGRGLGNGRQKEGFVPEHHTDFILSIIGEELGLVATLGILLAFVLLVSAGMFIAWRAEDTFGLLIAVGITLLIGLQAFINIGVVTSVLPNKGLPLPFISYGGSNLLAMLSGVGLLISVARNSNESALVTTDAPSADAIPSAILS